MLQVPIFNHLEADSLALIHQKIHAVEFKKGEYLFRAEEPTNTLYIIQSGAVRLFHLLESGKEQLIRILKPGDFIGEWSLFSQDRQYEDYAYALVDTKVCQLYADDFKEVLLSYPAVSLKILEEMSRRLQASEKMTSRVANESVGTRLVNYLLGQLPGQASDAHLINLELSRKELAAFLGTTPETISRKFKELETLNIIKSLSPRKIKIINFDGLLQYAN
ncbi:Crp/Fnr family transcriptional regulator [Globicatella sulfidifaciens]|uniref:CRP/FNR family transcriptional regulator, anaerobic regulatory protein n=1 Tax=Globicatella sulfidifaciens DSM 15739 TaxID=1121925 RepID=A0A1T4NM09_9LACT|nr:Crp/Fnr family transcriptional regulator [Globicatella sulfidifaciens]SJZ80135.1 CRP/FNR family transcriptional regulator, anaerobic regulatory protein [Globicatella sulfidifaciens DSM 15739]